MKSPSFFCCGAWLCQAAAAFFIPHNRHPSLGQANATATVSDRKPPSCLNGGSVTLYNTSSLPGKRSIDLSCGSYESWIDKAYKDCAVRARAGERVALAKDSASSTLLKDIFKEDSDQVRTRIADHLALIAVECEKNGWGPTPVNCSFCDEGVAGLTYLTPGFKNGDHPVTLCDEAIRQEPYGCNAQDLGDILLHEMSHSWGRTHDHGYGMKNILNLTTSEDSLDNGDSYTYFAQAAELGCIVQDDRLVDGSFKNEKARVARRRAGQPTATIATLKMMMVPIHIARRLLLTPWLSSRRLAPGNWIIAPESQTVDDDIETGDMGVAEPVPDCPRVVV
ncbi:hypothetical protein E4U28_008379 [Claviceps purpurea]|nr:hypothetical protein E4U28_008379 [Claviceps purpurea]